MTNTVQVYRKRRLLLSRFAGAVLAASLALPALAVAQANKFPPPLDERVVAAKVEKALATVDKAVAQGPFQPTWESLGGYKVPEWYQDAKFGIFIHWGVFSVPAWGNEWYSRNMYQQKEPEFNHHVETYGPQSKFGYKDFIPRFKAEKFDADAWAELFKKSGARYVVPVAEHHDGFAMYDTQFGRWSSARMGPHRDVIGELSKAIRRRGLHFGLSSHRAEHYWFFNGGREFDSDVKDDNYRDLYDAAVPDTQPPTEAFLKEWLARDEELVDKYHPELIYFDWWIGEKAEYAPYLKKFAAFYYNRGTEWNRAASVGPNVVLNYKNKAMPEGTAVLDVERGQLDKPHSLVWQTDTSVSWKSWCYIEKDDYKTPESLTQLLVDVVSKNGTLLLNIGPKADGTIPPQAEKILLTMGTWLATNGEAIYGTRPWKTFGEGPTQLSGGMFSEGKNKPFTSEDIRFTSKGDSVYAIAMVHPETGKMRLKALLDAGTIAKIESMDGRELKWTKSPDGVEVDVPSNSSDKFPFAIRVKFGK